MEIANKCASIKQLLLLAFWYCFRYADADDYAHTWRVCVCAWRQAGRLKIVRERMDECKCAHDGLRWKTAERHVLCAVFAKSEQAKVTGTFHFIGRKAMPASCILWLPVFIWDEMTDEQQSTSQTNERKNERKENTRVAHIAMKHNKILMHFCKLHACVSVVCAIVMFWLPPSPSLPSSSFIPVLSGRKEQHQQKSKH